MIRNSTSPTPTSNAELEDTRELLFIGFAFGVTILSFIFIILLLDRYYIKRESLREVDTESGLDLDEEEGNLLQDESSDAQYGTFASPEEHSSHSDDDTRETDDDARVNTAEHSPQELYQISLQRYQGEPSDDQLYVVTFSERISSAATGIQPRYTLSPHNSTILDLSPIASSHSSSTIRRRLSFLGADDTLSLSPGSREHTASLIRSPSPGSREHTASLIRSPSADSSNHTASLIKSPSLDSNDRTTSLIRSPSVASSSHHTASWMQSPNLVSGSDQNTSGWLNSPIANNNGQDISEWMLSPTASANEQNTSELILSPQGTSPQGSRLYKIYSSQLVPISPPTTPFIIELRTTPIPSTRRRVIQDIDGSSIDLSSPSSGSPSL
jgi:hypothetical protein